MHWPIEVAKAKEEKSTIDEGEIGAPNKPAATACTATTESKSLFPSLPLSYWEMDQLTSFNFF